MGVYDTVMVPCPKCGEKYPAQSKSGPCDFLHDFDLEPGVEYRGEQAAILLDVNRHAPFTCQGCGAVFDVAFDSAVTVFGVRSVMADAD